MNKKTLLNIALCLFCCASGGTLINAKGKQTHRLWYEQPADEWMKSTPLGNGRLGIMVYGGVDVETISLNEITMWSGEQDKFQERPCGKEALNDIRQLFFEGKYAQGNRMATELLAGTPHSFGSHVPTGDLVLKFTHPQGKLSAYKRELDIEKAINTVSYQVGNVKYTREYLCSNPDDALVIRLTANKSKALNFDISFVLLQDARVGVSDSGLEFSGTVHFPRQGPGGVNFMGKMGVTTTDGKVTSTANSLQVKDATSVTIVFDQRTDYSNPHYKEDCKNTVEKALSKGYALIKKNHISDYSSLYSRVALSLGDDRYAHLPTDERWKQVRKGVVDVGMDAFFFQYARYLLIAGSRANSPLPANLQGVWNDNLACNSGWTNDYHLDINTQQNYWLSNIGNLHECNAPLFSYIKDLSVHGQKTAQKVYGAKGWTAHTVANAWGYTASGSGVNWGLFPTASSWMASHLWTHYIYTQDKEFLQKEAYPILKSNAEFFLDYMVKDPKTGYLMTGPSTSPENAFVYNGEVLALSMMPTCDRELVYETFSSCIQAANILNVDHTFRQALEEAIAQLPPIMIGKNGAVQEWFEDFEEAQPNHRHTTHLLALYPFSQISPAKTPELAIAAGKTIEGRLNAENWEDVEWSRANMICFYARLFDAQQAYRSVVQLQRDFARENLLTISPEGIGGAPSDIFVFDGNEAGGAGIAEMLVQSHEGYIEFLPALPQQWSTGYYKGLCVAGGAETDLEWVNGKAKRASIKATANNIFAVKLPGGVAPKLSKNGKTVKADINKGVVRIELKKGDRLELTF